MYLIAGLGNPGLKYRHTRHNAGFMFADMLAGKTNAKFRSSKFSCELADTEYGGQRCILIKPLTFMNESGNAVRAAADFYKIPPENIIVIFNDISLAPGKIRIRTKGSAGGHNGIKSIIACLGTDEFPRIKIGTGERTDPDEDLAEHVLGRPSKEDGKLIENACNDALSALELMLCGDTAKAMNEYN